MYAVLILNLKNDWKSMKQLIYFYVTIASNSQQERREKRSYLLIFVMFEHVSICYAQKKLFPCRYCKIISKLH